MKCMIVDDEPLARQGLKDMISGISCISHITEAPSAAKAMSLLVKNPVDLLFLDIQMPNMTGLEFLDILEQKPMVIITTAFPQFALSGYEHDVLDYLLKPISEQRLLKSVYKAYGKLDTEKPEQESAADYFFVRSNGVIEKIVYNDILYISAMQNYCTIHLEKRRVIVHATLKSMEEKLKRNSFVQVHKSFIVNIPQIQKISGNRIMAGNDEIPVSRIFRDELFKRLPHLD